MRKCQSSATIVGSLDTDMKSVGKVSMMRLSLSGETSFRQMRVGTEELVVARAEDLTEGEEVHPSAEVLEEVMARSFTSKRMMIEMPSKIREAGGGIHLMRRNIIISFLIRVAMRYRTRS